MSWHFSDESGGRFAFREIEFLLLARTKDTHVGPEYSFEDQRRGRTFIPQSFNPPNHIIINTFTIICLKFIFVNSFEYETWMKRLIRLATSKAGVVTSWSQEVSEMSARTTLAKCYHRTLSCARTQC